MSRHLKSIAWRFVVKATEEGRFSAMTLFAWLAIGVGIGAMISLLSVMYGFESALRDRVLTAYPHLMVKAKNGDPIKDFETWDQKLHQVDGLQRIVPYLEAEMIVQSDYRTIGALVWGVPEEEFKAMRAKTTGGIPSSISPIPGLVVGSELASHLDVLPGDKIRIISPLGKTGAFGVAPQTETFQVEGLYSSGHYSFDREYLFLLLPDAQDLLKRTGMVSGWHLWGKSPDEGMRLKAEVKKLLPEGWEVQDWTEFNSALFQSLRMEQFAMSFILGFAILIAMMNVVITLLMNVHHKRKNIGILRALGASEKQVQRLFLWQGMLLGVVGIVLGGVIATAVLLTIRYASFELPAFYYDRTIPFEIRWVSVAVVFLVSIAMVFIATWYPSWKAAKQDPIAAIRE